MKILAIDPGTEQSAWCVFDTETGNPDTFGQCANEEVLASLKEVRASRLVVEMFKSYGNVVGDSVLQTCVWIGRFFQEWTKTISGKCELIPRKRIVTQLCMNPRANDTNVRQALIDRWGGKDKAIGNKAKPGPLYGMKNDMWSALAVAVAWTELDREFQNKLK